MQTAGEQGAELLARLRRGDRAACDECIREHAPGVFRLALRLMRNDAEAEEVVQETFLNALRGISGFGGRRDLSPESKEKLYKVLDLSDYLRGPR